MLKTRKHLTHKQKERTAAYSDLWISALLLLLAALMTACPPLDDYSVSIKAEAFGTTPQGEIAQLFTLTHQAGMQVKITNYGGIVTSIQVPDKNGKLGEVTLGYNSLEKYIEGSPFFGALVGRYGNRIANGTFTLNDSTYTLAQNDGPNHLHGGIEGFDKKLWAADTFRSASETGLMLRLVSEDGEEGYPGRLAVTVKYIMQENALRIEYEATTDKPTIVNLTNHTYFNLKDAGASTILDHELMLDANKFLPVDKTLIPTGELREVAGTPMDFRTSTAIGDRIEEEYEQLLFGGGYDHCWVLDHSKKNRPIARVYESTTGRVMEVFTTEPGVQFYCGNFLNGRHQGRGISYQKRTGFCLETQHFPDSPNQAGFPSVVLEPGQIYSTATTYQFSIQQ